MFCTNCGKKIDVDSVFCHFCGNKAIEDSAKDRPNNSSVNKKTKDKPVTQSKADLLWDKFTEIYDSKGGERKKFEDLSSNEAWELISRISNNKFEDFIQEHKEQLNKQPYKVIEKLKNVFVWCTSGGYWFWMAQALIEKDTLKKPKDIALNKYIEEWQALIGKDFKEHKKFFSADLEKTMSMFFEYELRNFIESSESVKELQNELIEKIKTALFIQLFWGYLAGVAEAKYRE